MRCLHCHSFAVAMIKLGDVSFFMCKKHLIATCEKRFIDYEPLWGDF